MTGTVVNHSTFGGQRNRALLLMSRHLDKFAVTKDLQKNESPANRNAPEQKDGTEEIETGVLAGMRIGCRHDH